MRIKTFLIILIAIAVLPACNKEPNFNYPDGTVGISKITYFPLLSLKGSAYIAVAKGSAYTEPGINATANGATIPFTTSGSVNVNTPGIYSLTYTATNADGFSASIRRTVIVYSTDASAAANDLSGKYLRAATGQSATWTKLAPGVYLVDNPGGAAGVNLQVIAINPTGFTVSIPSQISSDGNTSSSTNFNYVNGNPPSYTLVFNNPTYGTSVRSFVKQ